MIVCSMYIHVHNLKYIYLYVHCTYACIDVNIYLDTAHTCPSPHGPGSTSSSSGTLRYYDIIVFYDIIVLVYDIIVNIMPMIS